MKKRSKEAFVLKHHLQPIDLYAMIEDLSINASKVPMRGPNDLFYLMSLYDVSPDEIKEFWNESAFQVSGNLDMSKQGVKKMSMVPDIESILIEDFHHLLSLDIVSEWSTFAARVSTKLCCKTPPK